MKIGVITFHGADNYGSVLQAYALTEYLNDKGYDAEIIILSMIIVNTNPLEPIYILGNQRLFCLMFFHILYIVSALKIFKISVKNF